jgi:hypothetical protein
VEPTIGMRMRQAQIADRNTFLPGQHDQ